MIQLQPRANYKGPECFMEELHDNKARLSFEEKALNDITSATTEMTQNIVTMAANSCRLFTNAQLKMVGSMKEGTKVAMPNEFDFVVLVQHRPEMETLCLKKCKQCGNMRVSYMCNKHTQTKGGRTARNQQTNKVGRVTENKSLKIKLRKAMSSAFKGFNENDSNVQRDSGTLKLAKTNIHTTGPQCTFETEWIPSDGLQKFGISVDVTPAIPIKGIKKYFTQKDFTSPDIFSKAEELDSFILVSGGHDACDGLCLRVSFTELELELMEEMKSCHKKCYRILKYIIGTRDDIRLLKSYSIKTAVLHHERNCKGRENFSYECLTEIINSFGTCVQEGSMYSICLKDEDIWKRNPKTKLEYKRALTVCQNFPNLEQLLTEESKYDFQKGMTIFKTFERQSSRDAPSTIRRTLSPRKQPRRGL